MIERVWEPREDEFGGIETWSVDPHNEVFEFWHNQFKDSCAILLHVDNHDDMSADVVPLNGHSIRHYCREELGIASFIAPAMYKGFVGCNYCFDPRSDRVRAYGRACGERFVGRPCFENRYNSIVWKTCHATQLPYESVVDDINHSNAPLILDIDIDAFECVTDQSVSVRKGLISKELVTSDVIARSKHYFTSSCIDQKVCRRRFDRTFKFLSQVRRPDLITIALSQNPFQYSPDNWGDIYKDTMLMLQKLYD